MIAPRYAPAAEEHVVGRPKRNRRTRPVARLRTVASPLTLRACAGLLILAALCSFLVAYRHSTLTQLGYQAEQLRSDLAVLRRQNSELEVEVARLGSLSRVEQLATAKLGMVRPNTTVAIASLERSGGTVVASGSGTTSVAARQPAVAASQLQEQGGFFGRLWDLLRRFARNTVEAARLGN